MPAPPRKHGRRRHSAQEPDRRLAVRREDPVAILEREHGSRLQCLVVPEDRVRADPPLAVVHDGTLVVCPQEHEVAVQGEKLVTAEAVDLTVRDLLAVADDATQVSFGREHAAHAARSIGQTRTVTASRSAS